MKSGGRFPYVPLEMSDRVSLPPGEIPGESVLAELPASCAVIVFDVLRAVLLAVQKSRVAPLYDTLALDAWEAQLLESEHPEALRYPLGLLVGLIRDGQDADRPLMAQACLALADWACERQATATALLWFEAAAICFPENGRYALITGRAYRQAGRLADAERWLKRAARLTYWRKDWGAYAFAVCTLGMVSWTQGSVSKALRYLHRSRRFARRYGERVLEGEIFHNLLAIAISSGDAEHVEEYAREAFQRYLPAHHRLPALAYDVAYFWLMRGHTQRALVIFTQLLPHFPQPEQRIQVLAALARAAGKAHDEILFTGVWAQAISLAERLSAAVTLPHALLDLGLGAAHFRMYKEAEALFRQALQLGEERGQGSVVILADKYIAAVTAAHNPDASTKTLRVTAVQQAAEQFAERMARMLVVTETFADE
jgi:tetratricopeptide (TPR) repeat protein